MNRLISFNARIISVDEARVNPLTQSGFYGRGVWTTIAIARAKPFLWQAHWQRLCDHAQQIGVSLKSWNEDKVKLALLELMDANKLETGRARLTFFARQGFTSEGNFAPSVWETPSTKNIDASEPAHTDLLIVSDEKRKNQNSNNSLPNDAPDNPFNNSAPDFSLTVSPFRVNTLSPLTGLKTLNYLEPILSWQEARGREFHEAVRLNERGEIASASLANIFWTHHATLYTPTLLTGALAGTTRALVLQLAERLNIPSVEVAHDLTQLSHAEEIFLTSAGIGIRPVTAYDFHRYSAHAGNLTAQLLTAFNQSLFED